MTKVMPLLKKYIMPNLPYVLLFWLFGKAGMAYRLAPGRDMLQKLIHSMATLEAAMESPLPSLDLFDMAVGLAGAVAVYIIVYFKKKNAKKFRKDTEYGSARWSV
jgi:type IV secretion system protein VirD4